VVTWSCGRGRGSGHVVALTPGPRYPFVFLFVVGRFSSVVRAYRSTRTVSRRRPRRSGLPSERRGCRRVRYSIYVHIYAYECQIPLRSLTDRYFTTTTQRTNLKFGIVVPVMLHRCALRKDFKRMLRSNGLCYHVHREFALCGGPRISSYLRPPHVPIVRQLRICYTGVYLSF